MPLAIERLTVEVGVPSSMYSIGEYVVARHCLVRHGTQGIVVFRPGDGPGDGARFCNALRAGDAFFGALLWDLFRQGWRGRLKAESSTSGVDRLMLDDTILADRPGAPTREKCGHAEQVTAQRPWPEGPSASDAHMLLDSVGIDKRRYVIGDIGEATASLVWYKDAWSLMSSERGRIYIVARFPFEELAACCLIGTVVIASRLFNNALRLSAT